MFLNLNPKYKSFKSSPELWSSNGGCVWGQSRKVFSSTTSLSLKSTLTKLSAKLENVRYCSCCFFIFLALKLSLSFLPPFLLELFNLLSMYNMSLLCGRRGLLGEVSFKSFVMYPLLKKKICKFVLSKCDKISSQNTHVIGRNSGESLKHNTVSIYCMVNLNH